MINSYMYDMIEGREKMINYIISSNRKSIVKMIKDTILSNNVKYDIEQKIFDLNSNTKDCSSIFGFKVYVFDVLKQGDIDAIEAIRYEQNDWNSIILIITKNDELKNLIINKRLYVLDYIENRSNVDEQIKSDFQKIMMYYDNREKCLVYEFNRIIKRIDYKSIITIEKEKDSKRCEIKTTYGNYFMYGNIKEIFKKLDKRFIKLSRSTIANIDQIEEYDQAENIIIFKNRSTTSDVSRSNRKKLIDACNVINYQKRNKNSK